MRIAPFAICLFSLSTLTAAHAETWPDLTQPPPAQHEGQLDAALIIGVENYMFLAKVPGALRSASEWYAYLTRTREIPVGKVKLLRDNDATVDDIETYAAEAARQVQPGGTLWLIFIGHGAPMGSDGLLVGVDAQRKALSVTKRSIPQKQLLSIVGRGPQARTVAIIDACFSGQSSNGAPLVEGLQPLEVVHLGRPVPKVVLLAAGRSDQFAGPLPGPSVSPRPAFSYLALGGLRGWADKNRDGHVTARELEEYSRETLQSLLTGRSQTPELVALDRDQRLGRSGGEQGPDIVKMVVEPPGSELLFGGGVDIRVPQIVVRPVTGLNINLDAERRLEAAMDMEEKSTARPSEKATAWCRLAELTDSNPYQAKARAGCDAWRAFADARQRLEQALIKDYKTLAGYLGLHRKKTPQKLAAVDAFLAAYQPSLPNSEHVASVLAIRDHVRSGTAVELLDPEVRRATEEQRRQAAARAAANARAAEERRAAQEAAQGITFTAGTDQKYTVRFETSEGERACEAPVTLLRPCHVRVPPGPAKVHVRGSARFDQVIQVPYGPSTMSVDHTDGSYKSVTGGLLLFGVGAVGGVVELLLLATMPDKVTSSTGATTTNKDKSTWLLVVGMVALIAGVSGGTLALLGAKNVRKATNSLRYSGQQTRREVPGLRLDSIAVAPLAGGGTVGASFSF